jgi:hypothetical protein
MLALAIEAEVAVWICGHAEVTDRSGHRRSCVTVTYPSARSPPASALSKSSNRECWIGEGVPATVRDRVCVRIIPILRSH